MISTICAELSGLWPLVLYSYFYGGHLWFSDSNWNVHVLACKHDTRSHSCYSILLELLLFIGMGLEQTSFENEKNLFIFVTWWIFLWFILWKVKIIHYDLISYPIWLKFNTSLREFMFFNISLLICLNKMQILFCNVSLHTNT